MKQIPYEIQFWGLLQILTSGPCHYDFIALRCEGSLLDLFGRSKRWQTIQTDGTPHPYTCSWQNCSAVKNLTLSFLTHKKLHILRENVNSSNDGLSNVVSPTMVKSFWPGSDRSGQFFVARVGSGQLFMVWAWIWKISPKNVKFFNFFPFGSKKISSGRVRKYPGQRQVGLLFIAGQK